MAISGSRARESVRKPILTRRLVRGRTLRMPPHTHRATSTPNQPVHANKSSTTHTATYTTCHTPTQSAYPTNTTAHPACHHMRNEPHHPPPPTNQHKPTNPPPRIPLHTQRGNNKYRHPSHQHNAESGLTQSSPPCPMPITGELRHITPPPATSQHNRQSSARTTANSRISPRAAARPSSPTLDNRPTTSLTSASRQPTGQSPCSTPT